MSEEPKTPRAERCSVSDEAAKDAIEAAVQDAMRLQAESTEPSEADEDDDVGIPQHHPLIPFLNTPVSERKQNDLWAAILFLSLCIHVVYISWNRTNYTDDVDHQTISRTKLLLLISFSVALSYLSVFLMSRVPKQYNIFACVSLGLLSTYLFYGEWKLLFFINLFLLLCFRGTVTSELGMEMQKATNQSALKHSGLFLLNFFSMALTAMFMWRICPLLWMESFWMILYFLFMSAWFWNVTTTLMSATSTGIAAREYLLEAVERTGNEEGDGVRGKSSSLLATSLSCALCSFGSICFGSLIITVTFLLSFLVRMATETTRDDKIVVVLFKALMRVFALIFQQWVERFNKYSVIYVALTGQPYMQGVHRTSQLLKDCPSLDKAVSAQGSMPSLVSACFMTAVLSGVVAVVSPQLLPFAVTGSLMVQYSSNSMVTEGFIATLFVCTAEKRGQAPERLQEGRSRKQQRSLLDRLEQEYLKNANNKNPDGNEKEKQE